MTLLTPKSPITKKSNTICVREISTEQIGNKWHNTFGIDLSCDFISIKKIFHWRCLDTGFEWYTPSEAAGDGSLYQKLQKFPFYYMADKWEFHAALNHIKPQAKVLEVGIGGAGFLLLSKEKGIDIEGMEINPEAIQNAQKLGLTIYPLLIDDFIKQYPAQKYDAVCTFQVLEHLPEPIKFLESALELLRSKGKLILSVPNRGVLRHIDPNYENLLDQPPHHMSHWTKTVFNYLPNILPVTVKYLMTEPLQPYHVDWFTVAYSRNWLMHNLNMNKSTARLVANRYTLSPVSLLLRLGLRKIFYGHTLLVILEKL
ncbi:MAG: class I SAM-dependent methyltransferase [Bacteroidia bacterium]|nr:class I SAM-dependent methyltransferase [Bacteroidia bacterium]MDW8347834.1 class I SAM-dependent methyltransferase [Bacteroidia bacterium]